MVEPMGKSERRPSREGLERAGDDQLQENRQAEDDDELVGVGEISELIEN